MPGMGTVRVQKDELLRKLTANRAQHRAIFEEALQGYRLAAIKELDAMLEEARQGKRIRRSVSLIEPMDQTKEYDKIIAMVEMSVDDVLELTSTEFQAYIMDDWNWKDQWAASNVHYSKTLGSLSE